MGLPDLDNPTTYASLDPSDFCKRIEGLPEQCKRAWEETRRFQIPPHYANVRNVVVMGMGGSAIGGDILADLASIEANAPPILVCRTYQAPPFVGPDTLAIASSYSGETEETLSAFAEAAAKGAKLVAITSGGRLADAAKGKGIPLFSVNYRGEPRAALGYSFVAPLGLLDRLGLLSSKSADMAEAVEVLQDMARRLGPASPTHENPAKQIAIEMYDHMVLVYGAGILGGVARRWKTQLNENAKVTAFFEFLPELNHNAIAGYQYPASLASKSYAVLLRPTLIHPRVSVHFQVTTGLLASTGIKHRIVEPVGRSPLCQALSTILTGDFVSYYLAMLYRTDPAKIEAFEHRKQGLSSK